jgi:hypothetical protein
MRTAARQLPRVTNLEAPIHIAEVSGEMKQFRVRSGRRMRGQERIGGGAKDPYRFQAFSLKVGAR